MGYFAEPAQIYATVEERKQRNRQAQAAFRERRSEYIKQLENTLQQHEELLQLAQRDRQLSAHHSSSMQRRISTLERILRDNGEYVSDTHFYKYTDRQVGIDVEAELGTRGEQLLSLHEPPVALSMAAVAGVRRPTKQAGTTGNTKLEMLKSKAASVRNSVISPLSSPQSQTSGWNDICHSSSSVTSPIVDQYGSSVSPMYPTGIPPLPEPRNLHRHGLDLPTSHAEQHVLQSPIEIDEADYRSRELPLPIDHVDGLRSSIDWQHRSQGDWSLDHNVHSGKLNPSFPFFTREYLSPSVNLFA